MAAAPSAARVPQPAYGEYVDYPETRRDESGGEGQEFGADRFARRIQWPGLAFLALLEMTWLVGLTYVIYGLL